MKRYFVKLQWSDWMRSLPLEISLALILGFVFAILGPYDTYRFEFLPRIGFWLGLSVAWFILAGFAELIGNAMLPNRFGFPVRLAIIYIMITLPMSAVVWRASRELTHGRQEAFILEIYWQTLLIGAGGSLIVKALLQRVTEERGRLYLPAKSIATLPESVPPSAIMNSSRLQQRLPHHLRSSVLALSSEDHYVRIHTAHGTHMVLMRLSDAIDELDGLPGERVHRSWWVATSAPTQFRARGRTAILLLPGDLEVPISAPYLKVAEAMTDCR